MVSTTVVSIYSLIYKKDAGAFSYLFFGISVMLFIKCAMCVILSGLLQGTLLSPKFAVTISCEYVTEISCDYVFIIPKVVNHNWPWWPTLFYQKYIAFAPENINIIGYFTKMWGIHFCNQTVTSFVPVHLAIICRTGELWAYIVSRRKLLYWYGARQSLVESRPPARDPDRANAWVNIMRRLMAYIWWLTGARMLKIVPGRSQSQHHLPLLPIR